MTAQSGENLKWCWRSGFKTSELPWQMGETVKKAGKGQIQAQDWYRINNTTFSWKKDLGIIFDHKLKMG